MDTPSARNTKIEPGPVTAEISAFTGAGTAYNVSTNSPKSDWIKSSFLRQ